VPTLERCNDQITSLNWKWKNRQSLRASHPSCFGSGELQTNGIVPRPDRLEGLLVFQQDIHQFWIEMFAALFPEMGKDRLPGPGIESRLSEKYFRIETRPFPVFCLF